MSLGPVQHYAQLLKQLDVLAGYTEPGFNYYLQRASRLRDLAAQRVTDPGVVLQLAIESAELDIQAHPNTRPPER